MQAVRPLHPPLETVTRFYLFVHFLKVSEKCIEPPSFFFLLMPFFKFVSWNLGYKSKVDKLSKKATAAISDICFEALLNKWNMILSVIFYKV